MFGYMKWICCLCIQLSVVSASLSQNVDINLLQQVNPTHPTSAVWRGFTASAYPVDILIDGGLAFAAYKKDKHFNSILKSATGPFVAFVLAEGLKYSINRQRPYTAYPLLVHPYQTDEQGLSFPSGHTTFAFNSAALLSMTYKKWYVVIPAYLWAAGVGYSRLYLGEHYPSDVLAGAAMGIGSAYLGRWLNRRLFHTNK